MRSTPAKGHNPAGWYAKMTQEFSVFFRSDGTAYTANTHTPPSVRQERAEAAARHRQQRRDAARFHRADGPPPVRRQLFAIQE